MQYSVYCNQEQRDSEWVAIHYSYLLQKNIQPSDDNYMAVDFVKRYPGNK